MSHERRTIYFSGHVQGVGFRYTALRAAGGHEVTGYVRNLPDGRVEVVAEGAKEEIDGFLADLAERMRGYIHKTVQETSEAAGQFDGFTVRF